jgi:integration host factor subunit beta
MKDIAKALAGKTGLPATRAQEILEQALEEITQALLQERRVRLGNFGIFEVKQRRGRTARNPRTGEKLAIPPRLVAVFRPGADLRERVAQLQEPPEQP